MSDFSGTDALPAPGSHSHPGLETIDGGAICQFKLVSTQKTCLFIINNSKGILGYGPPVYIGDSMPQFILRTDRALLAPGRPKQREDLIEVKTCQ